MNEPDLHRCADRVRHLADRIAAAGPRCAADTSLPELIGRVQAESATASTEMRRGLAELFPSIGWAGEDALLPSGDAWVYDPIDGAYYFLQGLPLWSSSLVLVRAGKPVLSVVYDPTMSETFLAAPGRQITCNGTPVRASPKLDPVAAVVLHSSIRDVEVVIVDGVVRKRNGRLLSVHATEWNSGTHQLEETRREIRWHETASHITDVQKRFVDNLSGFDMDKLRAKVSTLYGMQESG